MHGTIGEIQLSFPIQRPQLLAEEKWILNFDPKFTHNVLQ